MSVSCKRNIGGCERNGMNERSNGSCERPPAYEDNLFAVIRMAKERFGAAANPTLPSAAAETRFTLPGLRSKFIYTCVQKWISSSKTLGRAKIPSLQRDGEHPFFSSCICELNETHRTKTFRRNWDTFYGLREIPPVHGIDLFSYPYVFPRTSTYIEV